MREREPDTSAFTWEGCQSKANTTCKYNFKKRLHATMLTSCRLVLAVQAAIGDGMAPLK